MSRFSYLRYRQFRKGIYDNMIFISPEIGDPLLIFIREGNIDTQTGILDALGEFSFQEAVSDNGFEVILFDRGKNRAGICREVFTGNFTE